MKSIPFLKYTSFGNNFIILDETRVSHLSETEKSQFACIATNINFGIGADGVLVIQDCNRDTLEEINTTRHYWDRIQTWPDAGFVFRLFEPNGEESFSCGNGLMCVAHYLNQQYGVGSTRIMTEVPAAKPKIISIGTHDRSRQTGKNWINIGRPRKIPVDIAHPSIRKQYDESIDEIKNIEILLRDHDLAPYSSEKSILMSGYLVFTGEPHLVIFPEYGFSIKDVTPESIPRMVFANNDDHIAETNKIERRVTYGSWLVHRIGIHLNTSYRDLFSKGINVNFARVIDKSGILEYRCFERGINQETLACGTGALAVAFIARTLQLINANGSIRVRPHRCRWYESESELSVIKSETSWELHGNPRMLAKGEFNFNQAGKFDSTE